MVGDGLRDGRSGADSGPEDGGSFAIEPPVDPDDFVAIPADDPRVVDLADPARPRWPTSAGGEP